MTAAGFCSRCGERRDCSGCSCSPIARPYSFLARYTSAAGEIVFQAMHSDSFPLAAESTDAGRAREALALWEQPSRGALKIRAELWDGDAGLWIAGEARPNEFKPDFSMIGQPVITRGDEATVAGPSVMLHGGEFYPVRMEEGERYGETVLLPAEKIRA